MAHLVELLGKEIELKDGSRFLSSTLAENDIIGLYFSAHWCPPCRGFTPVLTGCYNKVKESGKKWEIVFISFDRQLDKCKEYYSSMPWLLLPYESDLKEQLAETYGVRGIPALILLDAKTGSLLSANARHSVEEDPNGDKYPWK